MLSFGQQFRARIVFLALVICMLILLARLFDLQCLRFEKYRDSALQQQRSIRDVSARRGKVCDRNGVVFAITSTRPAVWADPGLVEDPKKTAVRLSRLIDASAEYIYERIKNPERRFVWIEKEITDTQAIPLRILKQQKELPGIYIRQVQHRLYPKHELLGNLIGFCNNAGEGAEGLEYQADRYLRGMDGWLTTRKDNYSKHFFDPRWVNLQLEPEDGQDVFLTIDEYIQHITQRELQKAAEEFKPARAMAIVMNPGTGEILALALWPYFNPNDRSGYVPGLLRVSPVTDVFEPGSTMKVISGAMALNEGVVTLETNIFCENGLWQISPRRHLKDDHPMGLISFKEIIQKSSNIGIAKSVAPIDKYLFYDYLVRFGFGTKTGIELLPGESSGLLRNPAQWTPHSKISIPMGQEIGVTALQLLTAVSTIANRGTRIKPTIVKKIVTAGGEITPEAKRFNFFKPQVIRYNVIRRDTAEKIIQAMVSVTSEDGTGRLAEIPGYSVAGKTGTAQKFEDDRYSPTNYVSSFVGFAPASKPAISCIVVLDSPRKKRYGGTVAAPAFKNICEETLAYLEIPKDMHDRTEQTEELRAPALPGEE